jgi:hypothetical protein
VSQRRLPPTSVSADSTAAGSVLRTAATASTSARQRDRGAVWWSGCKGAVDLVGRESLVATVTSWPDRVSNDEESIARRRPRAHPCNR